MSGEEVESDGFGARVESLVQFGFQRAEIEGFLAEHDGAMSERLMWLEERRETASVLEDRIVAFCQHSSVDASAIEAYKTQLGDPFSVEAVALELERAFHRVAPWEPPMNKSKTAWFGEGQGDVWSMFYKRLAALDVSSHAAIAPLHRLFASPIHADELVRHLELVETDERRQRAMIQSGAEHLRSLGYAVEDVMEWPLLEALHHLERWQQFHGKKEQVRLNAVHMIQPFDPALASEFALRCSQLMDNEDDQALDDLSREVHDLAQALEQRRQVFSDRVREWRRQGIVFPHEGDLQPSDLMQWEANHETIEASVQRHLELVERWKRFARYWPSRVEASTPLIGHLEKTDELQDVVDEFDALWKQLELDGLELLQSYENAGLAVAAWQQRVFEDPLNTLERMTAERHRWDRRVRLMNAFDSVDTSFSGGDDIEMRRQLVASEDLHDDVLEEMEAYVERTNRRNERHRLMLDQELAAMRQSGVLEREPRTDRMNLRELEHHVAELTRSGGSARPAHAASVVAMRLQDPLVRELTELMRAGWSVHGWMELVKHDPVRVAKELSSARPHLEHHEVLRRRLSVLPWERDVALGLEVEMHIKEPGRLERLNRAIPQFTAHLAGRPVEDPAYRLHLWQPEQTRPTLVPIPEHADRPVLQPATTLEDAHEAMLEAMDHKPAMDVEETEPAHNNTGRPIESLEEEVRHPDTKHLHDDGVSGEEFFADDKWSVERWRGWREREERALEKQEDSPSLSESPAVTAPVEEVVDVAPPEEEEAEPAVDAPSESVASTESVVVEPEAEEVMSSDRATQRALDALRELVALLGLDDLANEVAQQGMNALPEVRRGLAQHVNITPRDVRVGRLLRLTLRLLPEGNTSDGERARMLTELTQLVAPLKRWMRRRLEARHSGAKGDFLADAIELGTALERIPGLGRHVPLEKDDWPLPRELAGLSDEIKKLAQSVNLPSAGGVKA